MRRNTIITAAGRFRSAWPWRWALAIAVLAAFGGGLWWFFTDSSASVESLLAQAYSERRTLEVRIPGARYAPMRAERDGVGSTSHRPTPLIEAELIVTRGLRKAPNDPKWLQAKARVDLLQGNYASSIRSVRQALEDKPDSTELLVDLASGYFEQAEGAGRPIDYGNAIEYLGEAIAKSPDDPVAVFNRALACERMYLYTQAVADWEHYLRLDDRSGWAETARQHLAFAQERIRVLRQHLGEPLLAASNVVAARNSAAESLTKIDERIDEYLHQAVIDWLPQAYPQRQHAASSDARSALLVLANWTSRNYDDVWLSDLVSGSSHPMFAAAIANLSQALKANDLGDAASAEGYAAQADRLFTLAHNDAGVLRARVEYIFGAHVQQDGQKCLRAATSTRRLMESKKGYHWLHIQFKLEQGTCLGLMGNLGEQHSAYESAADEASRTGYRTILLRTQDHLANLDATSGNFSRSWATIREALGSFWNGHHPAMRGYNLYFCLFESARINAQPHLQVDVWRDGLALSESLPDLTLRGMARSLMADAEVAGGQLKEAEHDFELAAQDLQSLPQTKEGRIARMEAEARLAEVEIQLGRTARRNRHVEEASHYFYQAANRLEGIKGEVETLPDNFLSVMFYVDLADAEDELDRHPASDAALQSAVALAEADLQSLDDEKLRLAWSQRFSSAYRALVRLKLAHDDAQGALELWEWYRGAGLRRDLLNPYNGHTTAINDRNTPPTDFGRTAIPPLPGLNNVGRQLPNLTNETVVSYVRLRDGFFAWIYDNRGVQVFQIATPAENLETLAEKFRRLCADRESNVADIRQTGRRLYDLLILPVASRLAPERALVIQDDDALTGLPFEVLVDEQNRYLISRTRLISSLGFYYRAHLRPSSPITRGSPALIAAVPSPESLPDAETSLPGLPDAGLEAENIARKFSSARLLLANKATLAAIRSRVPTSAIFHFAGHAVTSSTHSGLLVSDAIFTSESLALSDLSRMQLVVLSGCRTVGQVGGPNYDPESLIRLFTSAGVPHLIASRWNVDSRATKQFMELFYDDLLAGDTVSRALRRTELAVSSQPEMAHPYFWSGFTLFGSD
jgi:CHAT domain-containing protein